MVGRMAMAFSRCPGVRMVAVASGSPERTARVAAALGIERAHAELAALLDDPAVDVVYVGNATAAHATTTMAALRAGKSVLCEKPIATSAHEARQVESLARECGVLAMEAMWTLFLPSYRRFAEIADQQRRTGHLHLYADFGYPVSETSHPRLFAPGVGAGVLLDRAVYTVALALRLLGPVEQVTGEVQRTDRGVDRHASLTLSHSHQHQSQIAVSLDLLLQNRASLSSKDQIVSLEPPLIGAETMQTVSFSPGAVRGDWLDARGTRERLGHALRRSPLLRRVSQARRSGATGRVHYGGDQYLPMLEHFFSLVRNGRSTSDVMPLGSSVATLNVIDAARHLAPSQPQHD